MTVAKLELRQRVRTSRWPLVMLAWVLIIGAVSGLTWYATHTEHGWGSTLYDVVLFFVLGLSMLVVPSLTATSINGDRQNGVLATLQTTLLSSADIIGGKLVAAWVITAAFIVGASPFLVWAWIAGAVAPGRMLRAVAVLAVVNAVVCALGLMFSALTARTVSSAVLTYLSIAALNVGTVIAFLLSLPIVAADEVVTVRTVPNNWYQGSLENAPTGGPQIGAPREPTAADCTLIERNERIYHSERTWWLLALNPFVIVADAAPAGRVRENFSFEPLTEISEAARSARLGQSRTTGIQDECWPQWRWSQESYTDRQARERRLSEVTPVWPFGFAFLALLGGGATTIAIKRARMPVRRLARGIRIA